MDTAAEIGRVLRDARTAMGLTLEQVQESSMQMGRVISRSRLSSLERGDATLKATDFGPISALYGYDVALLVAEIVAMEGRPEFDLRLTANDLFWEGKALFDRGEVKRAAWMMDESSQRYGDDIEARALALTCAAHCYMRAGALLVAQSRAEKAMDCSAPLGESEVTLKAAAEVMVIRAVLGSANVAHALSLAIDGVLKATKVSDDVRAVVQSNLAYVKYTRGEYDAATRLALSAGAAQEKLHNFDLAAMGYASAALYESVQGSMRRARRLCNDARSFISDESMVETVCHVRLVTADVFARNGDLNTARGMAEEGLELAERFNLREQFAWGCCLLEQFARERGAPTEARRWRKRRGAAVPFPGFPAPRG